MRVLYMHTWHVLRKDDDRGSVRVTTGPTYVIANAGWIGPQHDNRPTRWWHWSMHIQSSSLLLAHMPIFVACVRPKIRNQLGYIDCLVSGCLSYHFGQLHFFTSCFSVKINANIYIDFFKTVLSNVLRCWCSDWFCIPT